MAVSDLSTKDKGIILSLFATQCYQSPENLFEAKEEELKKRIEELRKRDPFIYK